MWEIHGPRVIWEEQVKLESNVPALRPLREPMVEKILSGGKRRSPTLAPSRTRASKRDYWIWPGYPRLGSARVQESVIVEMPSQIMSLAFSSAFASGSFGWAHSAVVGYTHIR
ncbi:hypothetical protein B0H12DRAFT_1077317 [Mycena haematopus]|nr:hypothetical protein B0H12DRAFT_1077317 [Mycena haematopus]